MNNFKEALTQKIVDSRYNSFGKSNYDAFRFGKPSASFPLHSAIDGLKNLAKSSINFRKNDWQQVARDYLAALAPYAENAEIVYAHLNQKDRDVLVSLLAFRALGFNKIKLQRNNDAYWEAVAKTKKLQETDETYDPKFMHFLLRKFNLNQVGYDIKCFFTDVGIAINFIIEQYAYKNESLLIEVKPGDTVLDVGGCWGDTALYFAHKAGENGKVYSFEFIPGNLELHQTNTNLNPHLKNRIEVVKHPVSNVSDQTIYFKDNGPGSRINSTPFADQTGSTTTITIDDFVERNKVTKVDFIKMDIEGAETHALEGALETIKKFRPTLAIAIYHSVNDLINLPKWVLDLDLGYEIFIDHFTIHDEETILFARPKL